MGKAKSIVITVLLAIAVAVAAFFAAASFPVKNNIKRLNSIASNIHLGADFSGYAYTTVYPEGVITQSDYELKEESEKGGYEQVGGLYYEKENDNYENLDDLKARVESDAKALNARFGEKGYSSYSVAVEDGVSIKLSVPTNFSQAAYKNYDSDARGSDMTVAQYALAYMSAYGPLTIRTTNKTVSYKDGNGNSQEVDLSSSKYKDEWIDKATVDNQKTYSLTSDADVSGYFKEIKPRKVGANAFITIKFTKEGREKFKEITTLLMSDSSSSTQSVYFFVGDKIMINFSCSAVIDESKINMKASDYPTAQNIAITLNSATKGQALSLTYQDIDTVAASSAAYGENAALLMFIACLVVLLGVIITLYVKYKKLGALTSFIAVIFALIELYALMLLNIQVTFGVILSCLVCLAIFVASNVIAFTEVKRLVESGKTIQSAIKEAYKNVIMTITDMHIILVAVAILLAAIGVGEVAGCGLIAVVGVVASYVLYWFNRFMWYAVGSSAKDKFKFAGFNGVEYEDD